MQGFTSDRGLLIKATHQQRFDIGSNGYNDRWITVDGLTQLAQYVAPIQGRKNLLWITPGMPIPLLRDGGYGQGDESFTASLANMNSMSGIFAAGRNSIANFSGDPTLITLAGLQSGETAFPDRGFASEGAAAALGNPGWVDPVRSAGAFSPFLSPGSGGGNGLDMTMVHRLMDVFEYFTLEQVAVSPIDPSGVGLLETELGRASRSLLAQEVAVQSGGHAYFNSNDLPARLAEAIEEGSRYYTIAYAPPRQKPDGHYHRITVQLDIPGARLAYRRGYNAEEPKPPKSYAGADLIKTALEGKVPSATGILFDAKLEPSPNPPAVPATPTGLKRRASDQANRTPYDLIIGVSQDQITPVKNPDGTRSIRVQFAFDAYDINGKLLGKHSQNVSLNLNVDKYANFVENPLMFHEQIWFYPGPLFLRVGVYDQNSQKVGTLEIPVTIPKK